MDSSEVGKFGTLRLMKRLEPDKVVASFPIDDDEITLGRDPTCSIRLYYDAVSPIHCKIIMVERKVSPRFLSFKATAFTHRVLD